MAALGATVSTRIPGSRTRLAGWAYLAGGIVVLLVAIPLVGVAAFAFLGMYFTIGLQGPVMAGLLHDRVGAAVRSTMMSVESLSMQAGGALASLLVGSVAAGVGLSAGLGVVALAGVFAALVLWRDGRHSTRSSDDPL